MAAPCFYSACRKVLNVSNFNRHLAIRALSASNKTLASIQESEDEAIQVPKKIPRGPTDILWALHGTIERTAASIQYKYHDDPYLIPASNLAKRTFALAKESGRRSARFFVENYPHQFYHNPAEPNIEAFISPEKITKDTEVTEKMLWKLVKCRQVENAIQAYHNLTADGKELADEELFHNFFEMICFYGCKEPLSEYDTETLWFQQPSTEKRKTWIADCLADQIFQAQTLKSARLYNIYVLGLLKHLDIKNGLLIYKTMLQENIQVAREVYNHLISTVPYQTENLEARWNMVQSYMQAMADNHLAPDQNTFNAALETLSKCQEWAGAQPAALSVMAEMRILAVAPSLATYYFLLSLYSSTKRGRGTDVAPVLYEIMDQIRGQRMELQHPKDVNFLVTAMESASVMYQSQALGHDIHSFYLDNPHLIGGAYNENIYYYHFFRLLLSTETLDGFFDYYSFYVPYKYTPDPNLMLAILNKIDFNYAFHHLNTLWKDIVLFNQYKNPRVITKILEMMARQEIDEQHRPNFLLIATEMKDKVDTELARGHLSFPWTGESMGNLLAIFILAQDFAKAEETLKDLLISKERLMDLPSEANLKLACHSFFSHDMPDHGLKCLDYAISTCNYRKLGKKILESAPQYNLSSKARSKLEAILGAMSDPVDPLLEPSQ